MTTLFICKQAAVVWLLFLWLEDSYVAVGEFGNSLVCNVFLQRVMMQIVQELCKRPGLNRTGFEMPTIYIPNPSGKVILCD